MNERTGRKKRPASLDTNRFDSPSRFNLLVPHSDLQSLGYVISKVGKSVTTGKHDKKRHLFNSSTLSPTVDHHQSSST